MDERLGAVQDLEARLKQSQEMADLFINRERIFDLPPSPFPALAGTSQPHLIMSLCSWCSCLLPEVLLVGWFPIGLQVTGGSSSLLLLLPLLLLLLLYQ